MAVYGSYTLNTRFKLGAYKVVQKCYTFYVMIITSILGRLPYSFNSIREAVISALNFNLIITCSLLRNRALNCYVRVIYRRRSTARLSQ